MGRFTDEAHKFLVTKRVSLAYNFFNNVCVSLVVLNIDYRKMFLSKTREIFSCFQLKMETFNTFKVHIASN